ncbi:hypothetical protein C8R45DRAFT_941839 [Mycena sanguinolenta]|nr:hypothetical protein C8R45DRAFT_941839 [Mycena sanguinolenta]
MLDQGLLQVGGGLHLYRARAVGGQGQEKRDRDAGRRKRVRSHQIRWDAKQHYRDMKCGRRWALEDSVMVWRENKGKWNVGGANGVPVAIRSQLVEGVRVRKAHLDARPPGSLKQAMGGTEAL